MAWVPVDLVSTLGGIPSLDSYTLSETRSARIGDAIPQVGTIDTAWDLGRWPLFFSHAATETPENKKQKCRHFFFVILLVELG